MRLEISVAEQLVKIDQDTWQQIEPAVETLQCLFNCIDLSTVLTCQVFEIEELLQLSVTPIGVIAWLLAEGFEIQPTVWASAHGSAAVTGTAKATLID